MLSERSVSATALLVVQKATAVQPSIGSTVPVVMRSLFVSSQRMAQAGKTVRTNGLKFPLNVLRGRPGVRVGPAGPPAGSLHPFFGAGNSFFRLVVREFGLSPKKVSPPRAQSRKFNASKLEG